MKAGIFLLVLCACFELASVAASQAQDSGEGRTQERERVPPAEGEDATPAAPAQIDVLGEALAKLDAQRQDLGVKPDPTWARFPHPSHIPYTLPSFEGLYAHPLGMYKTSRTMANAIELYMSPASLEKEPQALHKLVYYLGVDKRTEGFRDYSVNLPELESQDALLHSLRAIYALGDKPLVAQSFGKTVGLRESDWVDRIDDLPQGLESILAGLISGLTDALRWQRVAFRNVPAAALQQTWELRELNQAQGDGLAYYPFLDDVARHLDDASLYYSCMKTVQASQDARRALLRWMSRLNKSQKQSLHNLKIAWETPYGAIVVSGLGRNKHTTAPTLISIDLGGDDTYDVRVGASMSIQAPISVCIDLSGNDVYRADDRGAATQGAGIFGAGILIDVEGNDQYQARNLSQGAGLFGLGLLLDEKGDDRYQLETSGQGCGFFGLGFCLDIEGDDVYSLTTMGQGFGGIGGGIGILANYSGKDHYQARTYVQDDDGQAGREVNISNAQGVGRGRRGDGADGHSWAGGLGGIFDLRGRDTYESGNWSLGAGYWFGTGIAFDGDGNDVYRSVYFTQGAAAHYANGTLVDEAGDDQHVLFETAGAAFAFGWDFANALFVNKAGDDRYEASRLSFGRADIRSNAMFFDLSGSDRYQLAKGEAGFGAADFRENYKHPDPVAPYNWEASSFGLFLDIGGSDEYRVLDKDSSRSTLSEIWRDNQIWESPAPHTAEHGHGNHGLGWDVPSGHVPELQVFDFSKSLAAPN